MSSTISLLYFRGVTLGLAAAAPIGPVNVEIIRRGLTRGHWPAFRFGLGACSADLIYLSLVLAGVTRWAQGATVRATMLFLGGLLLVVLGVLAGSATRNIRNQTVTEPDSAAEKTPSSRLRRWLPAGGYAAGLAMTLSNPMTIAYWIGVSASLSAGQFLWKDYFASLAGVATGTVGWVTFISLVSSAGRRWVSRGLLTGVNLLGALLLLGYGAYFVVLAVLARHG